VIETTARYRTKCPCCGEWIEDGDAIAFIEDDEAWVCESCGEDF
jgi:hypothetical protein